MHIESSNFERLGQAQHLLTRREAAVYLGVTERTLAVWKSTGRYNLPVVKIGRLAKYRLSDLDSFIERHTTKGGDLT